MSGAIQPSYQIGRSPGRCAVSGRVIEPGETYVAALADREEAEGFERVEYSVEAWEAGARPDRFFGFWRARAPRADEKPKLLIDDGSLLELFDSLDGAAGEQASLRFVLALILLRKRLLKHVGQRHTADEREMLVRRRGETAEVAPTAVVDPNLSPSEVESIADQLDPVLRGEA